MVVEYFVTVHPLFEALSDDVARWDTISGTGGVSHVSLFTTGHGETVLAVTARAGHLIIHEARDCRETGHKIQKHKHFSFDPSTRCFYYRGVSQYVVPMESDQLIMWARGRVVVFTTRDALAAVLLIKLGGPGAH